MASSRGAGQPRGPATSEATADGAEQVFGLIDMYSPLRYPGAKRQLVPVFHELVGANNPPRIALFVEPFAGGASVALRLAGEDRVDRILLADADPYLYAFWQIACTDTQWLIDAMRETEVTVAEWERFKAAEPTGLRDRALACLFLNRTSYSGILHWRAGPIGGRRQASEYQIDCRFPKDTIGSRLRFIQHLHDTGRIVDVWGTDFATTVEKAQRLPVADGQMWFYFDPPFYAKSQTLYRQGFDQDDHRRLADLLAALEDPWVLSYDDHPEVRNLYADLDTGQDLRQIRLRYTSTNSHRDGDELIVTNLAAIPSGVMERHSRA